MHLKSLKPNRHYIDILIYGLKSKNLIDGLRILWHLNHYNVISMPISKVIAFKSLQYNIKAYIKGLLY